MTRSRARHQTSCLAERAGRALSNAGGAATAATVAIICATIGPTVPTLSDVSTAVAVFVAVVVSAALIAVVGRDLATTDKLVVLSWKAPAALATSLVVGLFPMVCAASIATGAKTAVRPMFLSLPVSTVPVVCHQPAVSRAESVVYQLTGQAVVSPEPHVVRAIASGVAPFA